MTVKVVLTVDGHVRDDLCMKSKYTVTYDRDESGAWIAQVRGVREAHSYGRTIDQARERVREALSLWRTDAVNAEFLDEIHLPAEANGVIAAFERAKARSEREQRRAQESAGIAARELTGRWRLSLRDAGELLGVSRQRVQQIRASRPRGKKRLAPSER